MRIDHRKNKTMRTKYSEPVLKVIIRDGFQHLEMPNGEILPKVVWTRVFDSCEDGSYVIAKILVNIGKEDSKA